MSLPLREVTTPFKGRGPFRNYGPFANKGPFGRNADYSFWNRRMFWNKAAYDAAPGGRKTLMSVALMAALGYNFATSTSNAPGTVIGSDGTVQYGAHNLLAYSADFSQWSLNNSVTLNGAGSPISYNGASIATSQFVSNGTNNGPYKTFSVTPASGQAFTVFAFIRRVSGSGSVKIGSDAGTFAPVTLDPGTGGLSGGNATASGSLAVGNAWLVWATYASAGTAPNAVVYGAAASTAFEAAVAGVYGSKVLDYVATTSAAIYAPRITYDRGASSNAVPQSQDWATGWTKAGGNDSISGQSLVAGATSGSHALYRSVTMSAAQWTLAAEFVKGSQQATLGVTDGGTDYFAVLDTATGSIVSVQAGATARVEPSVAGWILSVTRTLANATVNAFWGIAKAGSSSFTGGGESVACNGMWTTLGPARGAYLRTFASVPLYTAGTPVQQNLLPKSSDLTTVNSGNTNQVTATATTLTIGATASSAYYYTRLITSPAAGCVYSGQVVLSGPVGRIIGIRLADTLSGANQSTQAVTCTGMPQTITLTGVVPQSGALLEIGIENRTSVAATANAQTGDVFTFSSIGIVEGSVIPPGGIPATTGTPYSLYPQLGLLDEEGRARETLHPRDLTQAAWTKSGSMTAAKTATDAGGVANACSTLTSAGTNQTCLQSVTSASANRAFSPKIRARSAASLTIDLTCDGGTTWVATTVNAAWMKWPITQASVTNPSYGFRLRANGDSVDVDEAQGEQGAFATSFIWGTESAAQTRSIDQDTSTIVPGNAGTWCVSFTPQIPTSSTAQTILKRGAAHLYVQSGSVKATDGTNTITIGTANAGILNTVALSWTGSTLAGSLNGAAAVTGSFTGTFGSGSTVSVGSDTTSTPLNGQIASWLSGNTAASTAQLALASAGLLA